LRRAGHKSIPQYLPCKKVNSCKSALRGRKAKSSTAEYDHSRHDHDGSRNRRKAGDQVNNPRDASETEIRHVPIDLLSVLDRCQPNKDSLAVDNSCCGRSRGENGESGERLSRGTQKSFPRMTTSNCDAERKCAPFHMRSAVAPGHKLGSGVIKMSWLTQRLNCGESEGFRLTTEEHFHKKIGNRLHTR
jgi:hypothetical protein